MARSTMNATRNLPSTRGIECPLTVCAAGEEVEILELKADTGLAARLREFGVVAGATMRVVSSGAPMILQLGETRLCLRGDDVEGVFVRVIEQAYAAMPLRELLEDADPA